MGRAIEVCQAVGQVHGELGAAADVERSIVVEVAGGREVEATGDGKRAVVGGQVRQANGRAGLVLNLGGRTRHGHAGVGGNRLDIGAGELQRAAIDVGAAR